MTQTHVPERMRKAFREMFVDLASAKADGRKEDAARAAYALYEPMLPAQKAMNAYKRRMLHAVEAGDTAAGLAAVSAFQRDLLACVAPDAPAGFLRNARSSMLRRAADVASDRGFSRELSMQASPVAETAMARAFEAWLDEKLAQMDAEIEAAEEASPAGPGPR